MDAMEPLNAYLTEIQNTVTEPSTSFILQAVAAVLFLLLVFVFLRRRQPKSIAAFNNSSGHIMVSRSAITELVQTACEQIPGIKRPRVKLRQKRGHLDLCVQLKLESNSSLRSVSGTLQDHLSSTLRENLGIENLRRVDILVTGLKSGKLPTPKSPAEKVPTPASKAESKPEPKHAPAASTDQGRSVAASSKPTDPAVKVDDGSALDSEKGSENGSKKPTDPRP